MKGFSTHTTVDAIMAQLAKPISNLPNGAQNVMGSLRRAAQATGVDFGFLLKTAQRESALNPKARAGTSSAAGLFQFVEQTWLGMLKTHGAKHGYGDFSQHIVKSANGRYSVSDPQARSMVLGLRYNAEAASSMAAELTAGNAAYLKGRIGRNPNQGELYAAHFLGPSGAAELITATQNRPQTAAASLFPQAAQSNRSIFYSQGRALNVVEVMANLSRHTGNGEISIPDTAQDAPLKDTDGFMVSRKHRLMNDQALVQLAFGNGQDQSGLLFSTQLLSAFGPEKDDKQAASGQSNPDIDWG